MRRPYLDDLPPWMRPPSLLGAVTRFSSRPSRAWRVWPLNAISRWVTPRVGFWHGDPTTPRVAMTFDDGPDPLHTPQVLDVLKTAGVRATFFLIGRRVDAHPELARRIVAEGHEIGNHSYRHCDLRVLSDREVAREIDRTDLALLRATGVRPRLFRPPFGMVTRGLLKELGKRAETLVQWSDSAVDWHRPTVEKIVRRVLAHARNGSIILMHDGSDVGHQSRQPTVRALPILISGLKDRGQEPVPVGDLLAARWGEVPDLVAAGR